jgi:drug/metabolite transporter (DMT)-like permease
MKALEQSATLATNEVAVVPPDDVSGAEGVSAGPRVELMVLASVALGAVGQLLLKASLLLLSLPSSARVLYLAPRWACAAGVGLGLSVYAIGTWFWVRSVARASISYLYPLSACSYALVALGGHLLFGETVHAWRWAGIAVMTAGVALLAMTAERRAP